MKQKKQQKKQPGRSKQNMWKQALLYTVIIMMVIAMVAGAVLSVF